MPNRCQYGSLQRIGLVNDTSAEFHSLGQLRMTGVDPIVVVWSLQSPMESGLSFDLPRKAETGPTADCPVLDEILRKPTLSERPHVGHSARCHRHPKVVIRVVLSNGGAGAASGPTVF